MCGKEKEKDLSEKMSKKIGGKRGNICVENRERREIERKLLNKSDKEEKVKIQLKIRKEKGWGYIKKGKNKKEVKKESKKESKKEKKGNKKKKSKNKNCEKDLKNKKNKTKKEKNRNEKSKNFKSDVIKVKMKDRKETRW